MFCPYAFVCTCMLLLQIMASSGEEGYIIMDVSRFVTCIIRGGLPFRGRLLIHGFLCRGSVFPDRLEFVLCDQLLDDACLFVLRSDDCKDRGVS